MAGCKIATPRSVLGRSGKTFLVELAGPFEFWLWGCVVYSREALANQTNTKIHPANGGKIGPLMKANLA